PESLASLDRDIADLVDAYLGSKGIAYRRAEEAGRATFAVAPDAVLPEGVGDCRRFTTGDARGAGDAEALNLSHPLVTAPAPPPGYGRGGARAAVDGRGSSAARPRGRVPGAPRRRRQGRGHARGDGRLPRVRARAAARRGGDGRRRAARSGACRRASAS